MSLLSWLFKKEKVALVTKQKEDWKPDLTLEQDKQVIDDIEANPLKIQGTIRKHDLTMDTKLSNGETVLTWNLKSGLNQYRKDIDALERFALQSMPVIEKHQSFKKALEALPKELHKAVHHLSSEKMLIKLGIDKKEWPENIWTNEDIKHPESPSSEIRYSGWPSYPFRQEAGLPNGLGETPESIRRQVQNAADELVQKDQAFRNQYSGELFYLVEEIKKQDLSKNDFLAVVRNPQTLEMLPYLKNYKPGEIEFLAVFEPKWEERFDERERSLDLIKKLRRPRIMLFPEDEAEAVELDKKRQALLQKKEAKATMWLEQSGYYDWQAPSLTPEQRERLGQLKSINEQEKILQGAGLTALEKMQNDPVKKLSGFLRNNLNELESRRIQRVIEAEDNKRDVTDKGQHPNDLAMDRLAGYLYDLNQARKTGPLDNDNRVQEIKEEIGNLSEMERVRMLLQLKAVTDTGNDSGPVLEMTMKLTPKRSETSVDNNKAKETELSLEEQYKQSKADFSLWLYQIREMNELALMHTKQLTKQHQLRR
jgi:hypothetical protein